MKKQKYDPKLDIIGPMGSGTIEYKGWSSVATGGKPLVENESMADLARKNREMMSAANALYNEAELDKLGSDYTSAVTDNLKSEVPVLPPLNSNLGGKAESDGFPAQKKFDFAGMARKTILTGSFAVNNDERELLQQKAIQRANERTMNANLPTSIKVDRTVNGHVKNAGSEFNDDSVSPIILYFKLNNRWGEEWLDWEPETIIGTAEQEGEEISTLNMSKLFAIRAILKTDKFFSDHRTFEKVCLSFAGRHVDWGITQKPRVHEMCAAIALVDKFLKTSEFNDEVAAYAAAIAVDSGFIFLPPQLRFAQFAFDVELLSVRGEEVLDDQARIEKMLKSKSVPDDIDASDTVQYVRLMQCQYYVQELMSEVSQ